MERRKSKQIHVGNVAIGGDAPVVVQSMTTTDTGDVRGTLEQIHRLVDRGCEIVRIAVPDKAAAAAVPAGLAPAGDCMTFTSARDFETFNASVGNVPEGVEDFEAPASNVPSGVIVSLLHDPLAGGVPNVNTNGLGFSQGLLNLGLGVRSNLLGAGAEDAVDGDALPVGILHRRGAVVGGRERDGEDVADER